MYNIALTISPEYPIHDKAVLDIFQNKAKVKEYKMPFRVLSPKEVEEYGKKLADYDGILVRSGIFSKEIFKYLKKVKIIAVHGAGYDQVDVNAAEKHGICVVNTPGANAIAVAELVLGNMLLVIRKINESANRLKHDRDWEKAKLTGKEMYGKRLGLLGYGKIGMEVAKRALAFGMSVSIFDPYYVEKNKTPEIERINTFKLLLKNSDVVSLHMPLTKETRHIINSEALALMPEGSYLVNMARGGLVDEKALYEALNTGKIAGAALDVFEEEPLNRDNPLFSMENVVITPHIGGSTEEALDRVAIMASTEILNYLEHRQALYAVNNFQNG